MTDIDPSADIELTAANEQVTARIPLAGQVTGEWLGCYHRLARAAAVPVRAETQPDRAWHRRHRACRRTATWSSADDVMPLARWSKLAMTIQAIGSLAVLGLVVARAVNIFK